MHHLFQFRENTFNLRNFIEHFTQKKKTSSYWLETMTVCCYHVTYAFQSESTSYSYLNVKELLTRNRRDIWSSSDCNGTPIYNQLVRKRTPNYLAKLASLAKWLSFRLRIKWLWVRVPLKSLRNSDFGLNCHLKTNTEHL